VRKKKEEEGEKERAREERYQGQLGGGEQIGLE